jgi:outer membrane protein OmpA-like peptidoglycan-associated protein
VSSTLAQDAVVAPPNPNSAIQPTLPIVPDVLASTLLVEPSKDPSEVLRVPSAPAVATIAPVDPKTSRVPADLTADPPQSTGTPIPWPKDFVLPEIYWDFDKAQVRDKDNHPLSDLAQLLKENPQFHIEIHSHCDSRGSTLYNVDLSQRRAFSVQAELIELGVPASQMKSIGFGEYQIRNRCLDGVPCSESEHQFNRRTQFLLVEPQ